MQREHWTSPPLVAKEAPPAWHAVWRFRAVAIALLAVFVWLVFLVYQQLSGANAQDPDLGAWRGHLVSDLAVEVGQRD